MLIIISVAVCFIAALLLYLILGHNNEIKTVEYVFESEKVKNELKFLHIGDLHGTQYGKDNEALLEMIKAQKPDALLLTGDMLDEEVDISVDISFLEKIAKLFPIYAVVGNHEEEAEEHTLEELKEIYRKNSVHLLCNENVTFEARGEKINICGVDIPKNNGNPTESAIAASLRGIDKESFTITLFHRPDPCKSFLNKNIDLLLCGHTHGGHWIVPKLINGVYAPEQGPFPKYAGGFYSFDDGMKMVVTRGLSLRSTFIPRAFNRPELVVIKIK